MTHSRADKQISAERKWPRFLAEAVLCALLATLAFSQAGCASKPVQQPSTIQEFLKQPRPQ